MRKAIFLSWLTLLFFTFLILPKTAFAQTAGVYSDPSTYGTQEGCYRIEKTACGTDEAQCLTEPQDYKKADGTIIPEMRGDARLDFNMTVKGAYCGQVKSSPITLTETVPFPYKPWSCTIIAGWNGEIRMNNTLNVPFAQEMADEWAGTLDTEHMSVTDYNDLINRANGKVLNVMGIVDLSDQLKAQNEVNQKSGVLRKLLTMDEQDKLKCDFANYVAKKHNQGKATMYTYYSPDGNVFLPLLGGPACRNEVCPIGMKDRGTCLENYDNGTYKAFDPNHGGYYSPGPAWQMMGLIPNEKSRAELKFAVCGDKMYDLTYDAPEVFKLGLAGNQLFRIFTPKDKQDQFYKQYPDLANNPLNSNGLLKDAIVGENNQSAPKTVLADSQPVSANSEQTTDNSKQITSTSPHPSPIRRGSTKGEVKNAVFQKTSPFSQLVSFVQKNWPKVKTALAKTVETYKIAYKTSANNINKVNVTGVLLAQGTDCSNQPLFESNITQVQKNGKYSAQVNIRRTDCGKQILPGDLGHVRLYQDISGLSGTPHDFHLPGCNQDKSVCGEVTFDHSMIPLVLPEFNSEAELKQWLASNVLTVRNDVFGVSPTPLGIGMTPIYRLSGQTGGNIGSGRCDLTKACCETSSCTASCPACGLSQFGPSYTTVWPGGGDTRVDIGINWASPGTNPNDLILYSFKPQDSDCTFTADVDDFGQYTNCSGENAGCHGGKAGHWSCERSHDRIVDVYNNVPFLGSVWQQVADPVWGFMSNIKPLGVEGSAAVASAVDPTGCTTDQNAILDSNGNYFPEHGGALLQYDFTQANRTAADKYLKGADNIFVSLKTVTGGPSDSPPNTGKVLFYRTGGLCNANKWWTEKVLNPMLEGGLTTQGIQQNKSLIQICIQKNGSIDPNQYYDKSTCTVTTSGDTNAIKGSEILQGK